MAPEEEVKQDPEVDDETGEVLVDAYVPDELMEVHEINEWRVANGEDPL